MYPSRITRLIKQWLDENSLDYDKELHEFGIKPVMIQFTSKYDSLATSDEQTATKFTTLNNEIKVREHLRKLIVKRLTDSNLEDARHRAIANVIANNVYAVKQPNKATYVVEKEIDNCLDEIFINYHQLCQFKDNQNVEDNPCIYELDTNYDEGYYNEQTDRVICLVGEHVYLFNDCCDFHTEASTCLKGRSLYQAVKEDLFDELDEDEQDESFWEGADLNPDPCWY